jgi:integrase
MFDGIPQRGCFEYRQKRRDAMPKKVVQLTDVEVKKAKPKEKDYKLTDGKGLYLLLTVSGGKLWRYDYRIEGKRKTLALGSYPAISLSKARDQHAKGCELVAIGIDPGKARKADNAAKVAETKNTFEAIAREWHTKNYSSWVPAHGDQILRRLEKDIFPMIGAHPIADLKAADILKALQPIEARKAIETAHRVKLSISQVFRYAVVTSRAERDPSADLKGALTSVKSEHYAALTEPKQVAGLLRAIDGYDGSFVVKCALRLAPLVFVRPGELRGAEWAEIDFETALWSLPAEKMKMRQAHIVPLSKQALEVLRELHPLTGNGRFLFPGGRSTARPLSNNAINAALRRMGYGTNEMTGHGFRAMARTILDEVLQIRPDFIEHQLAHTVKDPNGRAYNRTAHLEERKKMMNTWSNYLDGLKAGAKVIPFRKQA